MEKHINVQKADVKGKHGDNYDNKKHELTR